MTSLKFEIPKDETSIIKVIGVGGCGGNAVDYMYKEGIHGVEYILCNTDNQALCNSPVTCRIQIGNDLTAGRGVGGNPDLGRKAALESLDEINKILAENTKMLFVTAGVGGGTGTGAAPVIAKAAMDMGILTVGIVTYPFDYEGPKRKMIADVGIEELKNCTDALIIIHNERILKIYKDGGISKAFSNANKVVTTAAKGIAEIITIAGFMNVDFEDVKAIMKNSGTAIMGSATADGEDRATKVVREALDYPLLKEKDIRGAKHILLNITYGEKELQMEELTIITNMIRDEAGQHVDMKIGHCYDDKLQDKLSLTIIATSFEPSNRDNIMHHENNPSATSATRPVEKKVYIVDENGDDVTDTYDETDYLNPGQMKFDFPEDMRLDESYIQKRQANEQRLQQYSFPIKPLNNNLEDLENKPAFLRRNIKLTDVPHSSDSEISKFTLDEDDDKKPEIKENNAFLDNNVD